MNMSDREKMLTPMEAAGLLKVHICTVRRLYRDGHLDYCRLGYRTVRIFEESINDYLQKMKSAKPKTLAEYSAPTTDFKKLPPAGIY